MLTLKHFFDRPTWAAAAGYEFNYLDCMAFMAGRYSTITSALRDVLCDLLDTTVRELPLMVLTIIAAASGVVVWPLIFWLVALPLWVRCRQHRRKYHQGVGMTEIARRNLDVWLHGCKRRGII